MPRWFLLKAKWDQVLLLEEGGHLPLDAFCSLGPATRMVSRTRLSGSRYASGWAFMYSSMVCRMQSCPSCSPALAAARQPVPQYDSPAVRVFLGNAGDEYSCTAHCAMPTIFLLLLRLGGVGKAALLHGRQFVGHAPLGREAVIPRVAHDDVVQHVYP